MEPEHERSGNVVEMEGGISPPEYTGRCVTLSLNCAAQSRSNAADPWALTCTVGRRGLPRCLLGPRRKYRLPFDRMAQSLWPPCPQAKSGGCAGGKVEREAD